MAEDKLGCYRDGVSRGGTDQVGLAGGIYFPGDLPSSCTNIKAFWISKDHLLKTYKGDHCILTVSTCTSAHECLIESWNRVRSLYV